MKLKLTLKSRRPSTVYSLNGKSYRLKPGVNVLDLSEEDYTALTKTLGIKPTDNSVNKDNTHRSEKLHSGNSGSVDISNKEVERVESVTSEETASKESDLNSTEECSDDTKEPAKEITVDHAEEQAEEHTEEKADGSDSCNDSTAEVENKVDFNSMTYNELKAEYKKITGKNCKLKKPDLIKFLQEHSNV